MKIYLTALAGMLMAQTAFGATIIDSSFASTTVDGSEAGFAVLDIDIDGDGQNDLNFADIGGANPQGLIGTYAYEIGGNLHRTEFVQRTEFLTDSEFSDVLVFVGFSEGDSIDESSAASAGGVWGGGASLYGESPFGFGSFGPIQNVGDSTFLAMRTLIGSSFEGIEFTDTPEEIYYGFLEVTHGSIILGDIGLQDVSGAAATIPQTNISAVPLPAGMPLLLVGLGALGFIRRKA